MSAGCAGGRATVVVTILVAAFGAAGCGTTYVDTSRTDPAAITAAGGTAPPTTPPLDAATADIASLLGEIERLMFDLDQRIVDHDDPRATVERIEQLWSAADRHIRADDPDDLFNFEQAIELARVGVERTRPADASKGYKIFAGVADAYLAG